MSVSSSFNAFENNRSGLAIRLLKKVGECAPKPWRTNCRHNVFFGSTDECTEDNDCQGVLKCCHDGCRRRCKLAQKTTACVHLAGAAQILRRKKGINGDVRCTKEGEFEHLQCNNVFCWCVDKQGVEIESSRTSNASTLDCEKVTSLGERKSCQSTVCHQNKRCIQGFEKDTLGCDTCECANPCKNVECPHSNQICVLEPVDCFPSQEKCPHVPKCIINVCLSHETLFRSFSPVNPKICQRTTDCPTNYFCRVLNNDSGFCCLGNGNVENLNLNKKYSFGKINFFQLLI